MADNEAIDNPNPIRAEIEVYLNNSAPDSYVVEVRDVKLAIPSGVYSVVQEDNRLRFNTVEKRNGTTVAFHQCGNTEPPPCGGP